ncbi:hypothetical protein ES703_18231 [subsurface metagenome]
MDANAASCFCNTSRHSPIEAWGIVVGIYRNEPSSKGGINSLPSPGKLCTAANHNLFDFNFSGTKKKTLPNPSHTIKATTTTTLGIDKNAVLCLRHQPKMSG